MAQVLLIDIDDTLADTQTHILDYVNSKAARKYVHADVTRILRESDGNDEYGQLVVEWLRRFDLVADVDPYPHAVEALQKLKAAGYELHATSSRRDYLYETTVNWLKEHQLFDYFDEVHKRPQGIRGHDYKVQKARDHRAAAAFDDTFDVAIALAEAGLTVYLITKPWNQDEELHERMVRARDFAHAVELFLGV